MPSKNYYRSVLPDDILNLIGNFAGDDKYQLHFTHSKKRKFLSFIELHERFSLDCGFYPERKNGKPYRLHTNAWLPVRIGNFKTLLELVSTKMSMIHLKIFRASLCDIHTLLSEVHDYTLDPKNYNTPIND